MDQQPLLSDKSNEFRCCLTEKIRLEQLKQAVLRQTILSIYRTFNIIFSQVINREDYLLNRPFITELI